MEQQRSTDHGEQGYDPALDNYDAVPRDGPAVFVTRTHLAEHQLRGAWIGLTQPDEAIAEEITRVTGRPPVEGGWSVVDQIGLGGVMCDEDITFDALTRLARQHRQEASP